MKTVKLETPRKFKFNGFFGRPTYGDGAFTVGQVYETLRMRVYPYEEGIPMPTEVVVEDDNGKMKTEEVTYFTEIL